MVRAAALALFGAVFLIAPSAQALEFPTTPASATTTGARANAPSGWLDFCERYRTECRRAGGQAGAPIPLTPENWNLIEQINRQFNDTVKGVPDRDHWGIAERWDFAEDGRGDCEDYVLLKRRAAMAAGLPAHSLLITVVLDTLGDGHAVLTIRTDRGDFILDNVRDAILPWNETGYKFLKRQSVENENLWVALDAQTASPAQVASN